MNDISLNETSDFDDDTSFEDIMRRITVSPKSTTFNDGSTLYEGKGFGFGPFGLLFEENGPAFYME